VKNKKTVILIILFFAFFAYIFLKQLIINDILLSRNHTFTEATITQVKQASEGGPDYVFYYIVNKKNIQVFLWRIQE